MKETALGSLMVKRAGSVDPAKFPDEKFDLYSIPAYDRGTPDVVAGAEIGSSKQIVTPGDILLSRIIPHIRRAWVVGPNRGRRIIASGEWIVFRSFEVEPRWLRHYLLADRFHRQFMQTVAGVGGSLLRARPAQVSSIRLSVPPLDEQRRIAGILDHAYALSSKRSEAGDKREELASAIFASLFGDPISNKKSWPMRTFGDLISSMRYGPRFHNESYSPEGIRIVRITDLDRTGRLNFGSMPRMVVSDDEVGRSGLSAGDIIFARTGATVGKLALIREGDPSCIAGAYFIRIRLRDCLEPEFAAAYLRSKPIQAIIKAGSYQSAQQNFSGPGLRALPCPLPPIELQRRFTHFVTQLDVDRSSTAREAEALDELVAAVQSRAFSGQL